MKLKKIILLRQKGSKILEQVATSPQTDNFENLKLNRVKMSARNVNVPYRYITLLKFQQN